MQWQMEVMSLWCGSYQRCQSEMFVWIRIDNLSVASSTASTAPHVCDMFE